MAYTRRMKQVKRRASVKRRGVRYVKRRMGAFGMYRGTRGIAALRGAARSYGNPGRYLNPFPNTKLVRHKYVDGFSMPAAGGPGLASVYQFRANCVVDPDLTGTGHQPLFRDEMAAQYKFYTVLSSRIRITMPETNAQENHYLLWVDDDTTVPNNANDACEQHGSSNSLQRLDRLRTPHILRASLDVARWSKTTRSALLADDLHKTAAAVVPAVAATKYYSLCAYPLLASTTITAIPCKVEIFYTVLWREPVDHTGS